MADFSLMHPDELAETLVDCPVLLPQWRRFGSKLGLKDHQLDIIEKKFNDNKNYIDLFSNVLKTAEGARPDLCIGTVRSVLEGMKLKGYSEDLERFGNKKISTKATPTSTQK